MANCNDHKNPLQRNGLSQPQRLLPGLDPTSAPVIDKTPIDWMVWASRLSQSLQYYNRQNVAAGNMSPFFGADLAARLAMVATHPLDAIPDFTREQLIILHDNANSSKTALLRKTFTSLFDLLFGYFQRVDAVQKQMVDFEQKFPGLLKNNDFPFQLNNHINGRLLSLATRALSYYKAAITATLTETTSPGIIDIFQQPIGTAETIITEGLSETWWQGNASWTDWVNSVSEEPSIFGISATISGKIQHAAHHNFFTGLLDEISASAAFLVALAKQSVQKLLADWPNHQPHYALFLAWLQLLENPRNDINKLTARHLDYYYERVLRLLRQSPVADKAFLSLELNKAVNSSALIAGTSFLGGKDSAGNDILYKATRETVLNKAVVQHLQSIYLADSNDNIGPTNNAGRLFASPIANSADGIGGKLTSPLQEWHPFFGKTFADGELQSIDMPMAEMGLAIASHYLRLKEGKRKITLRLDVSNEGLLIGKKVRVMLTTEKEWLELNTQTFAAGKMLDNTTNAAILSLTISADKPAITGYTAKTHGHRFTTTEPVLKLLLPNTEGEAYQFAALNGLTINKADLEVQVGEITGAFNSEGLKDLQLQNDNGPLNAAKPFQPFGNEPTPGNALIIGSNELFYKPNATVQFNLEWKDLPGFTGDLDHDYDSGAEYVSINSTNGPYNPEIDVESLESGNWVSKASNQNLFPYAPDFTLLPKAVFKTANALTGNLFFHPADAYPTFAANVNRGFMRLKLRHDFGHRNYHQHNSWYLLEKGTGNNSVTPPTPPYNPVLQSFSISYKATCSLQFSGSVTPLATAPMQWLHLAPFGDAQQHPALTGSPVLLLPELVENSSPIKAQGSLLLGLTGVVGGETISLLFQLMEGSENPLQAKPAEHLSWYYLAGNLWKPFETEAVDDGTAQLIRSGIIHFTIPTDIKTGNSLQDPIPIWIKASVNEAPDAVCKIIGIHTNAIEVQRYLPEGAGMEKIMAEAGTIAKMQNPDGKVKKVNQPYASFGGKALETGNGYYVRVSERLRHKDRAITIWDYERLVLQQFPEIYKVKCLNHTRLSGSVVEGNLEYNEVAPGYVTLITIPNLQQRNDADPLKPYTKKSTLEAIETFIKARTSCHVQFAAAQPQFEEIRMAATVVLAEGYEDILYYRGLLQQELTEWLCPWAFGQLGSLDFGGSMHKSVLIDFIEERPYVDYLTDVQLFHTPGEGAIESGDVEEAVASTARSVLVSAAASKHLFNVLNPASLPPKKITCKDE